MKRLPLLIMLSALLGITANLVAQNQAVPPGRTLYAPLDGQTEATQARGSKLGKTEGPVKFAPGKVGQGLVVGDVEGVATGITFATAGHLSLERGTVSMWVQPLNWAGDDRYYHALFNVKLGANGQLMLYKHYSSGLAAYVDPEEGLRGKTFLARAINDWKPGEWHHLALTWTRRDTLTVYVDGKVFKQLRGAALSELPLHDQMSFGGDWQRHGGQTVIDEIMVFERMLADHEIAALAGQTVTSPPADTPRDLPGVMMTQAVISQQVLARIYRDATGVPADRAVFSLTAPGAAQPARTQNLSLTQPLTVARLDTTGLAHGPYEARVALYAGETLLGSEVLGVSKETDETWETIKQIGRKDSVLPPYTPLKVAGQGVEYAGRRTEIGGSGLPAVMTSRGQALLAGPVRVVATVGGQAVTLQPQTLKMGTATPTQVEYTGGGQLGALALETRGLARYEGTHWTTLRFRPQGTAQVQKLQIEIPLQPAVARYLNFMANARIDAKRHGYDLLPEGQGVIWSREFMPSLWLGNEELGLGWYAESDEHWDIEGEEAITIERTPAATVLRMNIIRQERSVNAPFTIEFGLQGTPVRPLAPDWRSYEMLSSPDITRFFMHLRDNPYPRADIAGQKPQAKVTYLYQYHHHFTNTLPRDPEEFRQTIAKVKEFGLLGTPYTDTQFFVEDDGDVLNRWAEIRETPSARGSSYGPHSAIACCHCGPVGDWFVWYVSHLVRVYGSNGIYLDDMWPYGCDNAAHGCGYVGPDGKRRITYSLRARAETYRRIRQVLYETGEPFWVTNHISAGRVPPLPMYGDSLLLAEDLNPLIGKNPDYLESVPASRMRAGYLPESWGIPVVFLPQFKMSREWMADPVLAQRLLALVIPHDQLLWPLFIHNPTALQYREALGKFGYGEPDTRFVGYWQADSPVKADNPQATVSLYVRPGKAMLCVANWTAEELRSVTLTADLAALKLPANTGAREALTGEARPVTGGKLSLNLPAKSLTLIVLEP